MTKLICFSGQAGSGKDTAANFLADVLMSSRSEAWSRMAFANPVKDIFCQAFGVTRAFIEEWKRRPEPPPGFSMPVRKGLQFIGDGFRAINPRCWIDMALNGFTGNGILSDGRYINEGHAVCERSGLNVVCWRPGHENDDENKSESEIMEVVRWCLSTNQDGVIVHHSGQPKSVNSYHYFLRNDDDIERLYWRIKVMMVPYISCGLLGGVEVAA